MFLVQTKAGSASRSYLLGYNRRMPFQAAEVQNLMDDVDKALYVGMAPPKTLYVGMVPPKSLQENPAFEFLQHDLNLSAPAAGGGGGSPMQ